MSCGQQAAELEVHQLRAHPLPGQVDVVAALPRARGSRAARRSRRRPGRPPSCRRRAGRGCWTGSSRPRRCRPGAAGPAARPSCRSAARPSARRADRRTGTGRTSSTRGTGSPGSAGWSSGRSTQMPSTETVGSPSASKSVSRRVLVPGQRLVDLLERVDVPAEAAKRTTCREMPRCGTSRSSAGSHSSSGWSQGSAEQAGRLGGGRPEEEPHGALLPVSGDRDSRPLGSTIPRPARGLSRPRSPRRSRRASPPAARPG